MVGPEKKCPRCSHTKPWTEFSVRTRWPDGTARRLQSHCKACDANRGEPKGRELVCVGPFAEWMRKVMVRDDISRVAAAEQFGIPDRTIRRILNDQQVRVDVGLVDRVLTADDTTMLRELYPSLYEEAEAA